MTRVANEAEEELSVGSWCALIMVKNCPFRINGLKLFNLGSFKFGYVLKWSSLVEGDEGS